MSPEPHTHGQMQSPMWCCETVASLGGGEGVGRDFMTKGFREELGRGSTLNGDS